MRITIENKEWIGMAMYMGENGYEIFYDTYAPMLGEFSSGDELKDQCIMYQKYVEFGGVDGKNYDYDLMFDEKFTVYEKMIDYAEGKLHDAFQGIRTRFKME